MSRIGNKLITIPAGVSVNVDDNNFVVVTGPKGELSFTFSPKIAINVEGEHIKLTRASDSIEDKSLHGTSRALLSNMIEGVHQEFKKGLEIIGTGYRAAMKDGALVVSAGYSHQVILQLPKGVTVTCNTPTDLTVAGPDKQVVGQFAAEIRAIRKPEPYLGKGIRYKGENVRHKEGKKSK